MKIKKIYTTLEAAELLGISASTVVRHINAGRLTAYRLGAKRFRIFGEDLEKFIEINKIQGEK